MREFTPTYVLTSVIHVLIIYIIGAFMLINAAFIGFHVYDGYSNYQKKEALGNVVTGRVHKFTSMEFKTSSSGTLRACTAIDINGNITVRETKQSSTPSSNFCNELFSDNLVRNWKYLAPVSNGTSFAEKVMWSGLFFIVFMAAAYLFAVIPAAIVGVAVPELAGLLRLITLAFTTPVVIFWAMFAYSGWTYNPTHWTSPDGYTIQTEKVFITKDKKVYTAPESLFDWTSSNTMQKRNSHGLE